MISINANLITERRYLMIKNICEILENLKISYRIIDLNYKEISFNSIKTFDIEI